jgi:hypothetical protein
MQIQKIVLTGGPCSGKSIVSQALLQEFGKELIAVPETATLLLQGGYPLPGRDLEWSQAWQNLFQRTILPLQISLENIHTIVAYKKGCQLLLCDRGLLDGAAYTPGGVPEFCRRYKLTEAEINRRYTTVIHLQSVAIGRPENYGQANNGVRFESLKEALQLETATLAAWAKHPRRIIIDCQNGLEGKIIQAIKTVKALLA